MIFKVNLATCVVFTLASLGILIYGENPAKITPGDLFVLLIYGSPALLWIAGAWAVRRRPRLSIAWFLVSSLLMGVELFGLFGDAQQAREEAITKHQTQHLGGFLAMLLQWAIGLPLLAILAVIWLATRRRSRPEV